MKLCSDVLFQELSGLVDIEYSGKHIDTLKLNLPVFWDETMTYQDGMIYVGRSEDFPVPSSDTDCLIVAAGGELTGFRGLDRCCIFTAPKETNLFRIFNSIQGIFQKYETWRESIEDILEKTADIEEMLCLTSVLLGNSLGVCNKYLEVIASTTPDGKINPVPDKKLSGDKVARFAGSHARNIAMKELFTYVLDDKKTYCINFFSQGSYQGLLSMADDGAPITPGKVELFKFFFQYVSKAVKIRIKKGKSSTITMKQVFYELVNCIPVSSSRMEKAVSSDHLEHTEWVCISAKPKKDMENIPLEYLCSRIEQQMSGSIAFFQSPYIVAFIQTSGIRDDVPGKPMLFKETMEQLADRLFGYIGISNAFSDLTETRFYYRQSVVALETAGHNSNHEKLCHFKDYALTYALRNSTGELPLEYMLPESLVRLRKEDEEEKDYSRWDTLKAYLDNEMNAAQTARELYIHRTTMQNRVQRIENIVDLSTPESRMYIRYAMFLCEAYEKSSN